MPREIFPSPLVKQVVFAINYPNLFFMESRIGQFQIKVMREFPESSLLLKRHVVFAGGDPNHLQEAIAAQVKEAKDEMIQRVWQFKSHGGVELNVTSNTLSIHSERHKTYRMGESDRFRDIIESV